MKIIQQGAEAILYLEGDVLVKERIKKEYRLKEIDDKLRKQRTRKEAKLLEKSGINVPKLIDSCDHSMKIKMEFIKGDLIKDILDDLKDDEREKICKAIGNQVATLHNKGIIHGDLTTSNMFFWKDKVYFIDFGLGFSSTKVEDKAVDLYLLRQALESKHYSCFENSFKAVLEGYGNCKEFDLVMKRFEKVEKRRRYKGKESKE